MELNQFLTLIKPNHFRELLKQGLSVDQVYILILIKEGYDTTQFSTAKERAILQSLERKFFIMAGRLLPEADRIFSFLASDANEFPKAEIKKDSDFEIWWKTYPSTDTVINEGKILFEGSRGLKVKKEECKSKYSAILLEGMYTPEQLLAALKYEIHRKIRESVKIRENKMKYMQNSLTYLNQRTFSNFVELAEQMQALAPEVKTKGTINI